MTRHQRRVDRLATLLPEPVAAAPERVLINGACFLIGLAALVAERPGSLLELWPSWIAIEWAVVMMCGGLAALVGYWKRQTSPRELWGSLERVGYLAIFLAASLYGVGVIVVFGWSGAFSGVVYLGIAFAKIVRLTVSTSARTQMLHPAGEPGVER